MNIANAGRTLQVALLAFIGLLFYVGVITLLGLAGNLLISTLAHATTAGTADITAVLAPAAHYLGR